MLIYKVTLCLDTIIRQLARFDLREYNDLNPLIFVEANDPDDACHKAFTNLIKIILKQDYSKDSMGLIQEIINEVKITSIRVADEPKGKKRK